MHALHHSRNSSELYCSMRNVLDTWTLQVTTYQIVMTISKSLINVLSFVMLMFPSFTFFFSFYLFSMLLFPPLPKTRSSQHLFHRSLGTPSSPHFPSLSQAKCEIATNQDPLPHQKRSQVLAHQHKNPIRGK